MSEIYGIEELHEVKFPIKFKTTEIYQHKYPVLMDNFKTVKYKRVYFY